MLAYKKNGFAIKWKFLLFVMAIYLVACEEQHVSEVFLESDTIKNDTIFFNEFVTDRLLAKAPLTEAKFNLEPDTEYPSIAKIRLGNGKQRYLALLESDDNRILKVSEDSIISTNYVKDSILTYLWRSNNVFFEEHGNFIFGTENVDSLFTVFEQFRRDRKQLIDSYSGSLTSDSKSLLHYQNDARIYSFFLFYGRMVKNLKASNKFYDFIERVDDQSKWVKTFPNNTLYKYEIEYLRKSDSIRSMELFLNFIEERAMNADHADFLKAIYIGQIIDHPNNWEKHERLINAEAFRKVVVREKSSSYDYLIEAIAKVFLKTQKGELAYDFTAERIDGTKVKLSEHKGKIVFIDNWASWCGPCIADRPNLKMIASEFKNNDDIVFLFISLDSKKSDWINFLNSEGFSEDSQTELFIEKGMFSEYGSNYNIKFIPKYMLIDKEGLIVDSNLEDLVEGKRRIDELTKRNN